MVERSVNAMPHDTGQHVVITVHGIRTFGAWQRRLERLIAPASKDVRFYHFEYGYFSLLAFIIPLTRWLVVRRFQRELRSIFGRVKPSRLDLVAHSFGTHLVGWALRGLSSEEDIRVHTVILSGSVLRSDFYWADLVPTRVQRVINDCGSKDSVLLASQFLVLFTGMAGRVGFIGMNGPEFSNRYSNFGHGGYFQDPAGQSSDAYMTKYWVPAISGTDDIVPLDERNAPTPWRGFVIWISNNFEPIKLLMTTGPLLAGLIWIGALYIEANATKERLVAVIELGQAMKSKDNLPTEAEPLLSAMQQALAVPLRQTDLLWVDDDPDANLLEQSALKRFGLCFTPAKSTAEALQILASNPGKYSVVISDFRRDKDPQAGYGLLEEMKKRNLSIPYIFYVLRARAEQIEEAKRRGATAEVSDAVDLWVGVFNAMYPNAPPAVGRIELIIQRLRGC